jgi:starvation-inducible DNA-binding protein
VPALESIGAKSSLKADNGVPSEEQMLANLVAANETVVKSARACLELAEEAGDQATADLMTQRCAIGEKAAWMLRAHIAK